MSNLNSKVDKMVKFNELPDGRLEICYFDDPKDSSYLSWTLPSSVVEELIKWWSEFKKSNNTNFPIKEERGRCEIVMHTGKYIDIREMDELGRLKWGGWSLPRVVVEEILKWKGKKYLWPSPRKLRKWEQESFKVIFSSCPALPILSRELEKRVSDVYWR